MTICRVFAPVEGKKCCRFWCGGGICSRHGRLRCIEWLVGHQDQTSIEELLSHPEFADIPVEINVMGRTGTLPIGIQPGEAMKYSKSLLSGLPGVYSFSQIQSYQTCRRKWYNEYVKRVKPITTPHYFVVGRAGHAIMERLGQGIDIDAAVKAADDFLGIETGDEHFVYRIAGVKGVARAWAGLHPDLRGETEVSVNHPLLPMRGFIDLVQDKTILWEHKFASELDWQPKYRSQAFSYFGCKPEAQSTQINVIRKPPMTSCKPKKGESVEAYESRMFDLARKTPSEWFAIHQVERDTELELEFAEGQFHLIDEIEGTRAVGWNIGYFPRNEGACRQMRMDCQYLPLCESGRLDTTVYTVESRPVAPVDNDDEGW